MDGYVQTSGRSCVRSVNDSCASEARDKKPLSVTIVLFHLLYMVQSDDQAATRSKVTHLST